MHPRTAATLAQLDEVVWFSRVGQTDTTAAVVPKSRKQAMRSCNSAAWENLTLEAGNRISEQVFACSRERMNLWNTIVDDLKATVVPFVAAKVAAVRTEYDLPPAFVHCVNWDILHLCLESESADIVPPAFFAGQAYWYLQGHFPCGWRGRYPSGTLLIY